MRILKWLGGALALLILWGVILLFGGIEGWFRTPIAPPGDAKAFMSAAVPLLEANRTANVAFVLIEEGRVYDSYYSDGMSPDTLFPVASMSKWPTAYGIMLLVDEGRIDLDAPVSRYLTRWQLPVGDFDNDAVTVRRLLSHTAGLGDDLGFGDYAADEEVPSLEASLAHPRASSGKPVTIAVAREPGSEWQYSGGGYLLLELVVEEVSGMRFDDYMRTCVFQPLGMTRSTYAYLGDLPDTARSLTADGSPAPFYRYAASGATGLATTAHDLTRFLRAQLPGSNDGPLAQPRLEQMRVPEASVLGRPIWGLGTILYAPTDGGGFVFGHAGMNEPAINADARLDPDTGDGIVVLVNGDPSLATRLGFLWTFWQTGRPDFIGVEPEIRRTVPWFLLGALVIFACAAFGWWRGRHRSVRETR